MKTQMLPILWLAASLALLSGCISTVHINLDSIKEPSLIGDKTNPRATPTPEFAAHVDHVIVAGHLLWTFPTGEVAKRVFVGAAEPDYSIGLISSQLTIDQSDSFPIPVFSTTAHYQLSCLLQKGNKKTILSTSAIGESMISVPLAARLAVERAMLDISKQATLLLD